MAEGRKMEMAWEARLLSDTRCSPSAGLTRICPMCPKWAKLLNFLRGEKCEAFFDVSRTFLYLNERGDRALSNGGKHNPVQCLERWQIAVEN